MKRTITEKQWGVLFCSAFLLIGLLLFPVYKYQINPDGIAYLSIARHYASGRYIDALNSCWPPLLSWILAPWANTGIELLWIFKIYNVIAGALCLWTSHRILLFFKAPLTAQLAGLMILSATYLMWAYSITTPDLMSVYLMLLYTQMIISGNYLKKPLITGLLGAIAYFTKSYCFFFFAAHLTFQYAILIFSKKQPLYFVAKRYLLTMLVFLGISVIWMLLLYQKYHHFTISSASAYTHGMLRFPNLQCVEEFVPPPHAHAIFAWEDPPLVCPHQDWSMFNSPDDFLFQLRAIYKNTLTLFRLQAFTGYFHLLGFVLMIVALIKTRRKIFHDPLFLLFPIIIVYSLGYLLIFIEPRYVWIGYALITIGTVVAIERLLPKATIKKGWALPMVAVIVTLSLVGILYNQPRLLAPVKRIFSKQQGEHSTYDFYHSAKALKTRLDKAEHMAGWGTYSGRLRAQSSSLAYFTGVRYFGLLPKDEGHAQQLIDQHRISILIIDKSDTNLPSFITSWRELSPAGELRIFKKK